MLSAIKQRDSPPILKSILNSIMDELEQYAGCDGWASMLRHEWHLPQFPFIFCQKLNNK